MKKINFTKMVASGNDFVIVQVSPQSTVHSPQLKALAKRICDRKFGIGADGLLVLQKSKVADIRMRIFNADGSEAEMCGNGARCIALYTKNQKPKTKNLILLETKAGIIKAQVNGDRVKIKLTDPKGLKLNMPIRLNSRTLRVNFINTGVPHTVIFAEGLDKIDVVNLGRQIRLHKTFAPQGTNVDFVEVIGKDAIKVRTYERGVEEETLACGTGAVASALITVIRYSLFVIRKINVATRSKETLKVYFDKAGRDFHNVWLEGKAKIVFEGEFVYTSAALKPRPLCRG